MENDVVLYRSCHRAAHNLRKAIAECFKKVLRNLKKYLTNEKRCCIIYSQGKESLGANEKRRKERMDRLTRQRALILDIIRSDKCHHTAEEIGRAHV